jgi:hypothetical protein
MDKRVASKISEKIRETNQGQIGQLARELGPDSESFRRGIIAGRLYNSFYYQTRRILKREPTQQEFDEFLKMLKDLGL